MASPARPLLPALALAAALAGCALEPVRDSDQISTRDLRVDVHASDEGSGASVRIALSSPLGTVRLVEGDTLRATMAGEPVALRLGEEDGQSVYRAEPAALVADLVLDLERENDRSALGVVVEVPPPFTLTAAPLSGGAPLALSWEGAAGDHTATLLIEGDCIVAVRRDLAVDTGAYSVAQAELSHLDPPAPATCPLRVTLTRVATTQRPLMPGVEGGHVGAHVVQRRSIQVGWSP